MIHNTPDSVPTAVQGKSRMKISVRDGIHCWFDVDDITIRVWGSAWTGREIVRVEDGAGDHVVSDKRSFRFTTPHEFEYGGHCYRLEFGLNFSVAEIRLYRDGVLIDSDLHDFGGIRVDPETGRLDWNWALKRLGPAVLAGALFGAAFGYWIGSLWK